MCSTWHSNCSMPKMSAAETLESALLLHCLDKYSLGYKLLCFKCNFSKWHIFLWGERSARLKLLNKKKNNKVQCSNKYSHQSERNDNEIKRPIQFKKLFVISNFITMINMHCYMLYGFSKRQQCVCQTLYMSLIFIFSFASPSLDTTWIPLNAHWQDSSTSVAACFSYCSTQWI